MSVTFWHLAINNRITKPCQQFINLQIWFKFSGDLLLVRSFFIWNSKYRNFNKKSINNKWFWHLNYSDSYVEIKISLKCCLLLKNIDFHRTIICYKKHFFSTNPKRLWCICDQEVPNCQFEIKCVTVEYYVIKSH